MNASFASTFLTAVASVGACVALSLALAEGMSVAEPKPAPVKLERVVVEGHATKQERQERREQMVLAQASQALVK